MKECTHQILDGLHDPLSTALLRTIPDDPNKSKLRTDAQNWALSGDTSGILLFALLRGKCGER